MGEMFFIFALRCHFVTEEDDRVTMIHLLGTFSVIPDPEA